MLPQYFIEECDETRKVWYRPPLRVTRVQTLPKLRVCCRVLELCDNVCSIFRELQAAKAKYKTKIVDGFGKGLVILHLERYCSLIR